MKIVLVRAVFPNAVPRDINTARFSRNDHNERIRLLGKPERRPMAETVEFSEIAHIFSKRQMHAKFFDPVVLNDHRAVVARRLLAEKTQKQFLRNIAAKRDAALKKSSDRFLPGKTMSAPTLP